MTRNRRGAGRIVSRGPRRRGVGGRGPLQHVLSRPSASRAFPRASASRAAFSPRPRRLPRREFSAHVASTQHLPASRYPVFLFLPASLARSSTRDRGGTRRGRGSSPLSVRFLAPSRPRRSSVPTRLLVSPPPARRLASRPFCASFFSRCRNQLPRDPRPNRFQTPFPLARLMRLPLLRAASVRRLDLVHPHAAAASTLPPRARPRECRAAPRPLARLASLCLALLRLVSPKPGPVPASALRRSKPSLLCALFPSPPDRSPRPHSALFAPPLSRLLPLDSLTSDFPGRLRPPFLLRRRLRFSSTPASALGDAPARRFGPFCVEPQSQPSKPTIAHVHMAHRVPDGFPCARRGEARQERRTDAEGTGGRRQEESAR